MSDNENSLPPATPPPPVMRVRFEKAFACAERLLARLDGFMNRLVPAEYNPLEQTGQAANLVLIICALSGVFMLIWYAPSVQLAYPAMASLQGRTLGGWMRTMHRYSSDFVMLLLILHAARMFIAKKFTGSRWLAWTTGVFLLALTWFVGWTGFWLVWDQPAQQVAIASMQFIDVFPIFGEPMSRQFLVDRLVPSLLFFVIFFLHMLLPLGIAAGLVLHLSRLNRVRIFPDRWLGVAIVATMAIASWIVPAPLDAPAAMAVKAPSFTVDAWYLTPLALGLRFQSLGLWACFGGVAFVAAFPWLLARRNRKISTPRDTDTPVTPWQTVVLQARCHACTQCVQDCPFGAVSMIPRTDGKKFPARAWVNPNLCVGCAVCVGSCDSEAMNLTWFDIHADEQRISTTVQRLREKSGSAFLALVAADMDGGFLHFQNTRWQNLLPGYHVEPVPTASWVRPKFVERLLHGGASGVLIVRDTRDESAARDGNRWIRDRMEQTRKPHFHPGRANHGRWHVADFNAANPSTLTAEAHTFREGGNAKFLPRPGRLRALLVGGLLALALAAATIGLSHLQVLNPAPSEPELVLSFRVLGDMMKAQELDEAAQAKLPVHMRGRSTTKPRRSPTDITLTVGGKSETRTFQPKGVSNDGPTTGEWVLPLAPGLHEVRVEIKRGPESAPEVWSGTLEAKSRHIQVITYTPTEGFRFE